MTERQAKIEKRNAEIIKLIEDGLTYSEIGKKYGLTKQGISNIAIKYGIKGGYKKHTNYYPKLVKKILGDIDGGVLTYQELKEKYDLNETTMSRLRYHGITNLYSQFMDVRNSEILNEYKNKTAKNVTKVINSKLDDPNRITTENGVYRVTNKVGYKKYPKIGNRNAGGSFEDRKILKYIADKRDNHSWTFQKISDKLNKLGYKSISGVEFNMMLVRYKYKSYKKNKYKRLKY